MESPKLSTAEFYARNDDLAKRYGQASESARTNILGELYKLDLHLFQAWRILGEDRDDYRQSAVFWLSRALDTFKPSQGPFVNWLRFYVQKTFDHHVRDYKSQVTLTEAQEDGEAVEPEDIDPVFWKSLKSLASPEEWEIVQRRFVQGKEMKDIAEELGTYREKVRASLKALLERYKASTIKHHDSPKNLLGSDPSGAQWMRRKDIAPLLGLTLDRLANLTAPNRKPHYSPMMIHPSDILRTPSIRIRYLVTDKGVIYPRFVRRPK